MWVLEQLQVAGATQLTPATQSAVPVAQRFFLSGRFSPETALSSASWPRVGVADRHGDLTNHAVHARLCFQKAAMLPMLMPPLCHPLPLHCSSSRWECEPGQAPQDRGEAGRYRGVRWEVLLRKGRQPAAWGCLLKEQSHKCMAAQEDG